MNKSLEKAVMKMPGMVTCREADTFLDGYLDATLPWRQRLIFAFHLLMCPLCKRYLAAYARTRDLARLSATHGADAEAPLPESLKQAILKARR